MRILVGKIVKSQGVKGELKMDCFLDDGKLLLGAKQLYLENVAKDVETIRSDGRFCYVLFSDIKDRNKADMYKEWSVYADKESIPLSKDRYFVDDLINCEVSLSDGQFAGRVVDVLQYGSADVFVVDNGGKRMLFPWVKELFISVDVENKKIVADAQRFSEVCCDEN